MPSALVTSVSVIGSAAGPTVTAARDTSGTTLLVVSLTYYTGPTLTDSKSNTWSALTETANGGNQKTRMYYAENPTVGTNHTFTTTGADQYCPIQMLAFSVTATAAVFDQQNGAVGSSPGSVTPGEDNEILVAAAGEPNGTITAIDGGFTLQHSQAFSAGVSYGQAIAYLIQTSAAAANPAWTGINANGSCRIATFKAAAAGGAMLVHPGMDGGMKSMPGGLRG